MLTPNQHYLPMQPVNKPILCNPYEEPTEHWVYDRATGEPSRMSPRRPASYWYKTQRTGSVQGELFAVVDFKTTRPCYATIKSHINQVVLVTITWEQSAAFRLEPSDAVAFYARNDHLEFVIPYEYLGISHGYTPDYLVRLSNGVTLILEIKGYEDDQDRAKHQAAQRWKGAVNRWGQLGPWDFHICRNPQMLGRELEWLCHGSTDSL
jgi:hypothetical protein